MKLNFASKAVRLAALAGLFLFTNSVMAANVVEGLELVRSNYQSDRQTFLAKTLEFTEQESAAFWPLYRSYRADMEKLGDGLVKLVLEYADVYPNVPDGRARQMLKEYAALEEKLAAKRTWYLKRAGKILPAAKVLCWAQLENRMDLALRLQLAGGGPVISNQPKP